jgi:hypothetical protein
MDRDALMDLLKEKSLRLYLFEYVRNLRVGYRKVTTCRSAQHEKQIDEAYAEDRKEKHDA